MRQYDVKILFVGERVDIPARTKANTLPRAYEETRLAAHPRMRG
jgi:hypothetical protein